MGYLIGVGVESIHVVEQLSFSMIPSMVAFEFDLNLGVIFYFLGPYGLIFGFEQAVKAAMGSTHVIDQLLSSMFSSKPIF